MNIKWNKLFFFTFLKTGQIFGIVVGVLLGGLLIGAGGSYLSFYVYFSYKKKNSSVPSIRFKNEKNEEKN